MSALESGKPGVSEQTYEGVEISSSTILNTAVNVDSVESQSSRGDSVNVTLSIDELANFEDLSETSGQQLEKANLTEDSALPPTGEIETDGKTNEQEAIEDASSNMDNETTNGETSTQQGLSQNETGNNENNLSGQETETQGMHAGESIPTMSGAEQSGVEGGNLTGLNGEDFGDSTDAASTTDADSTNSASGSGPEVLSDDAENASSTVIPGTNITKEMLEEGLNKDKLEEFKTAQHEAIQEHLDVCDDILEDLNVEIDELEDIKTGSNLIYGFSENYGYTEQVEYQYQMETALKELKNSEDYDNMTDQEIKARGEELGLSDELIYREILKRHPEYKEMSDSEIEQLVNNLNFSEDETTYFISQTINLRDFYSDENIDFDNPYSVTFSAGEHYVNFVFIEEEIYANLNEIAQRTGFYEAMEGQEEIDINYELNENVELYQALDALPPEMSNKWLSEFMLHRNEKYEEMSIYEFLYSLNDAYNQKQAIEAQKTMLEQQNELIDFTAFYYSEEYVNYKNSLDDFELTMDDFTVIDTSHANYDRTTYQIDYYAYCAAHPGENISIMDFISKAIKLLKEKGINNGTQGIKVEIKTPYKLDYSTMNALVGMRDEESFAPFADTFEFLYQRDPKAAMEFINLPDSQNKINKYKGYQAAMKEIDELVLNPDGTINESGLAAIYNELNIFFDGVGDGIYDWGEGFTKLASKGVLSEQDYKVMVYMAFLAEHGLISQYVYKTGTSVGNMLPSVTISMLLAYFAPELLPMMPFGEVASASKKLVLLLNAISSFGNTSNMLKFQGYEDWRANLYAFLSSTSGALFEKYLGGIIGLSNNPGANILQQMLNQGEKNLIQMAYINFLLDPLILEKPIDLSNFPEAYIEQCIIGFATAGLVNGYSGLLRFTIEGVIVELDGEDALEVIKMLHEHPNSTYKEATEIHELLKRYPDLNYNQALLLNQAVNTLIKNHPDLNYDQALLLHEVSEKLGVSEEIILKQNTVYTIQDPDGNKKSVTISSLEQWKKFTDYTKSGMTESEALDALLSDYAESLEYDGWLTAEDIKTHVKDAYDRLPDADKKSDSNPNGLSYEEFLKIKLQLIPYDPKTQIPNRYAEVQLQMNNSKSVTLFWGLGDMKRFLDGSYGNGIGRPASETQASAAFTFPTSEMKIPDDFSSWTPEARAKYLSDNLGLDSNNFKGGAFQIIIDESVYGSSWTHSDPYTQGSNQDFVPGMNTSSSAGKTEVVIPRVDDVIQSYSDPSIKAAIDTQLAIGDTAGASDLFLQGVENGTIILKPGVTIKQI